MRTTSKRDFVNGLAAGLRAMAAFRPEEPSLTLAEVARRSGLTRAAARRYLLTLVELQYAAYDGKHFSLTPKVLALSRTQLRDASLADLVQPVLDAISERTNESTSAAILDGTHVAFIARARGRRFVSVAMAVGTRLPAWCCATGHALLSCRDDREVERTLRRSKLPRGGLGARSPEALLEEIRRARARGYGLNDEEFEPGLRSIAVPVRNMRGEVLLAIGIGTHSARMQLSQLAPRLLPSLLQGQRVLASIL
ncbi:MAG TPA: IclR family transcriptional regulator C-terminal domain-containing protein [Burkholderiales bacterium]